MQINFNTYNNSPAFKAQFSKDSETIEVLKALAKENPVITYSALELVNNSPTSDVIKLNKVDDSVAVVQINYTSKGENKTTQSPFWNFASDIGAIQLSNGRKIGDYLPRLLSNGARAEYEKGMLNNELIKSEMVDNFKKSSNLENLYAKADELDKTIEMLNREQQKLFKEIEKAEDKFMERYIDTM